MTPAIERTQDTPIATDGVSKAFGRHWALDGVKLTVEPGEVFGYLGPNGSGKTTTIRLIVGLARPTGGSVHVFGLDVARHRDEVQGRIGYLPGDFTAYPDLTGAEYLRFLARLRGDVDPRLIIGLTDRLDLDLSRRIGTLSHGNRQKVGIVQAMMHRPELLVLDEPTAGLDPIVQREFLDLIKEARDEGRTVLLSSHVLSEVEQVADRVAMIRDGRLLVVESVPDLKAWAVRRVDLTFEDQAPPRADLAATAGVRDVTVSGRTAHLTLEGSAADLLAKIGPLRVERIVTHEPDLEEIFLSRYDEPRAAG